MEFIEQEIKNSLRIGVTGHRKLTGDQLSALEPAIKRAIENVIYYNQTINNSPLQVVFTSPLATGTDTLFANIAIKYFEGNVRVYLPFEKEEYLNDFETTEEKNEFERLLNDPGVIEVVCLNNLSAGKRDDLYLKAGKKVVDDNDYMIAVWDEEKSKGPGGTGDIVAYAVSLNKNVLVINPFDTELKIKGNYLPHLIATSKDQPGPKILSDNIVADYFNLFDRIAIRNQKAFKLIWKFCFRIGWVAALILSVKVARNFMEGTQFGLTVLEISCLSLIIILIWTEKRRSFHKNYLLYRFIAERLRINNLIYSCGYYPIKTETKVIHQALQEIESKYPVHLINKIIRLTSFNCTSLDQKKAMVSSFSVGQSNYHNKRKASLEKENERNSLIKTGCIILFAAVILYHTFVEFLSGGFPHPDIRNIFLRSSEIPTNLFELSVLLYLFIPATLARFEAVKYINDWERLITQSTYMTKFFSEISEKSKIVKDDKELYSLLIQLNDNMYLENLDWEMFMINKNETIT